ncbi:Uncharacterised protein [Actinobacillus indolicus]|nr:Uncharacterised protein [Actinobacillus indolicus]VTU07114.1 Uncharacterised protein [Actinobacillus indolicus]
MLATYLIYNLTLIFGGGLAFLSQIENKKVYKDVLYTLSFFIVWLVGAFRYNVGTDYPNYVYIFENIDEYEFGKLEPLYYLLNQLILYLNLDAQWLFFVTSFIITFFVYKVGKNYHRGWFVVFFILLFYFQSFNIVRQIVAMSIMLYGIHSLIHSSNWKFLICILFAAGFHYSAFIFLPLFIFRKVRIGWFTGIIMLCLCLFIITKLDIVNIILQNPIIQDSKYGVYAFNEYNKETEIGSGVGIVIQLLIPISFLLLVIFMKDLKGYSIISLLCIGFIISMLMTLNVYIFTRVMVMLSSCYLFAVSYIYNSTFRLKNILLIFLLLINVIMFEHTINIAQFNLYSGLGISPYQSILGFFL